MLRVRFSRCALKVGLFAFGEMVKLLADLVGAFYKAANSKVPRQAAENQHEVVLRLWQHSPYTSHLKAARFTCELFNKCYAPYSNTGVQHPEAFAAVL